MKFFHLLAHLDSKKITILLFLFSFTLSFFLVQGTPFFMNGEDDFFMAWTAMQASWNELFHAIFIERLSLILEGDNFYGNIAERGIYFFFFKLLIVFDGMRFPDLNHLLRTFLFSFTGILIYKLLEEFQVRKVFALGGALLYITAVQTYSVLHLIGDTTLYIHFFMLLCYYLFFTKYLKQDKTNPLLLSLLIFLSGLFALKSKQIAVTLPIVLLFYCIFVKQNIHGVMKRRIPLFSIALLYYLPSPFSVLGQQPAQSAFNNFLLDLKTYYLYNPWTNLGVGEQVPALFSPIRSYFTDAGSLVGTYKFLLGWYVLFFVICFVISSFKSLLNNKKIEAGHIFFFLFLWHISEVAIMGIYFQSGLFLAIRYVGIALPSFILLTFFCMQRGFDYITEVTCFKKTKQSLCYVFIFFLSITILSNVYSSAIPIRGAGLSRHTLIHDSIVVVYKDYFQKTEVDDTIFFRIFKFVAPDREQEEELSHIFFTDLPDQFGELYNPPDSALIQKEIDEKSFVYIATYRPELPFTNTQLLATLSACPPDTSAYCFLKDIIRGKAKSFYVYKVFSAEDDSS